MCLLDVGVCTVCVWEGVWMCKCMALSMCVYICMQVYGVGVVVDVRSCIYCVIRTLLLHV